MKKPYPFSPKPCAVTPCNAPAIRLTSVLFLLVFAALGSLSSCQRSPYALFSPTAHPAHQRLALSTPAMQPIPDSLLTASLSNRPYVAAAPVQAEAVTTTAQPKTMAFRQAALRHYVKRLLPGKTTPPSCDQIVLRSGDVIDAKVKEVGVSEVRYKKCDRQDGPDYTISKRDILSIKYSNGEVERFTTGTNAPSGGSGSSRPTYNTPPANAPDAGPRTDPFAIVAIATGGLAILTGAGAFLLGAAAVVFGAISLSRIRKEPGRFKGKGLAIAGMVAGIISAAAILLYIYL